MMLGTQLHLQEDFEPTDVLQDPGSPKENTLNCYRGV